MRSIAAVWLIISTLGRWSGCQADESLDLSHWTERRVTERTQGSVTFTINPPGLLNISSSAGGESGQEGKRSGETNNGSASSGNKQRQLTTPSCWLSEHNKLHIAWKCQGLQLETIPDDLSPKPTSLRLIGTGIEALWSGSLRNYKETLRDFSIENAPRLATIEPGTFSLLDRLRVIYIFQAPKLAAFDLTVAGEHPDLTTIRIQQTSLRYWPDLSLFRQERILSSLDLDNNQIISLGLKPINIRTELLNLEFNQIRQIDNFTFNGSEIGTLSLNNNRQLSYIHPNAFANLKNLIKLDLSSTSVTQLPTIGLHQLRTLVIRDTYTLRQIPSIYVFPMLEEARLTYAHHCCSFRYPQTHDPSTYEEHLRLQAGINGRCTKQELMTPDLGYDKLTTMSSQSSDFEGVFESEQRVTTSSPTAICKDEKCLITYGSPGAQTPVLESRLSIQVQRLFHNIECGELALKQDALSNVSCAPEPDAFNPCEDIMGYSFLRVVVWFVVGASWFGNLSAIVVLVCIFPRLTAPQFLQLNLAIADFFMGVYLASLALADLTTRHDYFNHAIDWQQGLGCKFAGASSLFASQLSIYTLCIITFERYYTITYSIDLNKRLNLGWAVRFMLVGWLYAFASAMLPIFADVNSYSMTSICLPLRTGDHWDKIFLMVLLVIDTGAFVIIFACYLKMYLLIVRQKTQANTQDRKVAKRMALLVATDFACWAPIIFYGMTALLGWPLISVTNSKILIVFFYPLNAMANPYMYVLSTRRYKREFNYLTLKLRNWRKGLFKKHDDSYYSQNTPYAVHKPANLSAQLGAVAAVTGVAHHMRRSHTLVSGAGANLLLDSQLHPQQLNEAGQLLPDGRRLVSSKTHKGSYIIRHQILTERASWHPQRQHPPRGCLNRRPQSPIEQQMVGVRSIQTMAGRKSADLDQSEAKLTTGGSVRIEGCSKCCRLCSRASHNCDEVPPREPARQKVCKRASGDKSTLVSILQPGSSLSNNGSQSPGAVLPPPSELARNKKRLSSPAVRIDIPEKTGTSSPHQATCSSLSNQESSSQRRSSHDQTSDAGEPLHRCAHAACHGQHQSVHRRCISQRDLQLKRRHQSHHSHHRHHHHHQHHHHRHHHHRHRRHRNANDDRPTKESSAAKQRRCASADHRSRTRLSTGSSIECPCRRELDHNQLQALDSAPSSDDRTRSKSVDNLGRPQSVELPRTADQLDENK